MQETQEIWVQSLGREDPLEKEMATHFSILAWETPWTEESACHAGDTGSIPESGRSPEEGMATHSSILAWEIP